MTKPKRRDELHGRRFANSVCDDLGGLVGCSVLEAFAALWHLEIFRSIGRNAGDCIGAFVDYSVQRRRGRAALMTAIFFCVGAAKAGTSWLHRQLSDHPECHFCAIKELHYFDAIGAGRLGRLTKHHQAQQVALKDRLAVRGAPARAARKRRTADRAAVPCARLLVEVFENMIAGPGFEWICDFLGISRITAQMAPVHAGRDLSMTLDQGQAAAYLAPLHDAAARFGADAQSLCPKGIR